MHNDTQKIIDRLVKLSKPSLLITLVLTLGLFGPIGNIMLMCYEGVGIDSLIAILAMFCFLLIILVWTIYFKSLRKFKINSQIDFEEFYDEYKSSSKKH